MCQRGAASAEAADKSLPPPGKKKKRTLCSLSPTTHEAGGWEEAAPSLDDVWCGAGDWDLGFK